MNGIILGLGLIAGAIFPMPADTSGYVFNPMSGWQPENPPAGTVRAEDGSYVPAVPGAISSGEGSIRPQ